MVLVLALVWYWYCHWYGIGIVIGIDIDTGSRFNPHSSMIKQWCSHIVQALLRIYAYRVSNVKTGTQILLLKQLPLV